MFSARRHVRCAAHAQEVDLRLDDGWDTAVAGVWLRVALGPVDYSLLMVGPPGRERETLAHLLV
jgi:hypothetical protein